MERFFLLNSQFRCLEPQTNCVYISRHVIFDEHEFPFATDATHTISSVQEPSYSTSFLDAYEWLNSVHTSFNQAMPNTSVPVSLAIILVTKPTITVLPITNISSPSLAKSTSTTLTPNPSFPSSLPSAIDLTNQVFVVLPIPSHSTSSQPMHPHSTLIPDPISTFPPPAAHTPLLPRNNIHGMITCAKLKQNPSLALHVSSTSPTEPKTLKSPLKQPK